MNCKQKRTCETAIILFSILQLSGSSIGIKLFVGIVELMLSKRRKEMLTCD